LLVQVSLERIIPINITIDAIYSIKIHEVNNPNVPLKIKIIEMASEPTIAPPLYVKPTAVVLYFC
jgi:hypothetical protein